MEIKTRQWTITTCFQVAENLRQSIFLVDAEQRILDYNKFAYRTLNASNDQQFLKTLGEALKTVDKKEWQQFWMSETHCLRLEEAFLNLISPSILFIKVDGERAIGLFMMDGLDAKQLQESYAYLLEADNRRRDFKEIVSKNEDYLGVLQQVLRVTETDANVLIIGETGTGKELIAQAIHNLSSRKQHPLFKINCAALDADVLEQELFGYETSAFPGAFEQKIGLFELANGSTLLLDKVGDLPLEFQPKLLNALQENSFRRLGSSKNQPSNVRIISITTKDLKTLMQEGKFRKDLYYFLSAFPIHDIPLRKRKDDIPLLVNYFRKKYAKKMGKKITKVSNKVMRQLMTYDFPGNIRELENLVERATILSTSSSLNLEAVLPEMSQTIDSKGNPNRFLTFEEMQRKHILDALERSQWRVSGDYSAATLLDLNPKTLTSKMRKLNIRREDFV